MSKGGTNWSQTLIWPAVFISMLMITSVLVTADRTIREKETKSGEKVESLSSYRVNWGLPKLELKDDQGKALDISELAKTNGLMTIWTSTCAECKTGLADLQKFHDQNPALPMTLVNYRDKVKDAKAVLTELNVTIPNYYDEVGESYEKLQATIPASYYFKDSKIYFYFPGRIEQAHLNLILKEFTQ